MKPTEPLPAVGCSSDGGESSCRGTAPHGSSEDWLQASLERVAAFGAPDIELEQYPTSAALACEMLRAMADRGDIVGGKAVLDLGAGCGVLSIGAALLGAGAVLGVDLDSAALRQAAANRDAVVAHLLLEQQPPAHCNRDGSREGGADSSTGSHAAARRLMQLELLQADIAAAEPGSVGCGLRQLVHRKSSSGNAAGVPRGGTVVVMNPVQRRQPGPFQPCHAMSPGNWWVPSISGRGLAHKTSSSCNARYRCGNSA